MKKSLLLLFAVALCPAATLFGQTFTGTWQGTLKVPQPPGELRIVTFQSSMSGDPGRAAPPKIEGRRLPGSVWQAGHC